MENLAAKSGDTWDMAPEIAFDGGGDDFVNLEQMRCFVCGEEIRGEAVLVVNSAHEDMVGVCRHHIDVATPAMSMSETTPP